MLLFDLLNSSIKVILTVALASGPQSYSLAGATAKASLGILRGARISSDQNFAQIVGVGASFGVIELVAEKTVRNFTYAAEGMIGRQGIDRVKLRDGRLADVKGFSSTEKGVSLSLQIGLEFIKGHYDSLSGAVTISESLLDSNANGKIDTRFSIKGVASGIGSVDLEHFKAYLNTDTGNTQVVAKAYKDNSGYLDGEILVDVNSDDKNEIISRIDRRSGGVTNIVLEADVVGGPARGLGDGKVDVDDAVATFVYPDEQAILYRLTGMLLNSIALQF